MYSFSSASYVFVISSPCLPQPVSKIGYIADEQFIYRHSLIKRRAEAERQAANDEWAGSTGMLAEELASGVRTPNGGSRSAGLGGTGAVGTAGGHRRNRRVRGLRRTESGATIRTLPEYSKEAGDEEVVLVRYVYLFVARCWLAPCPHGQLGTRTEGHATVMARRAGGSLSLITDIQAPVERQHLRDYL